MLCRDPYDYFYAYICNFTLYWYHLEWSITNVRNVIRETPIFSFIAVYWWKDSSDCYLHRQKGIYYVAPMYTYLMRFYVRRMLTEVWNHQLNIKCKMFISSLKYNTCSIFTDERFHLLNNWISFHFMFHPYHWYIYLLFAYKLQMSLE